MIQQFNEVIALQKQVKTTVCQRIASSHGLCNAAKKRGGNIEKNHSKLLSLNAPPFFLLRRGLSKNL